jgi:hypothetical protein
MNLFANLSAIVQTFRWCCKPLLWREPFHCDANHSAMARTVPPFLSWPEPFCHGVTFLQLNKPFCQGVNIFAMVRIFPPSCKPFCHMAKTFPLWCKPSCNGVILSTIAQIFPLWPQPFCKPFRYVGSL